MLPTRRTIVTLLTAVGVAAALVVTAATQLPALGAGAVLHPWRSGVQMATPEGCEPVTFAGRDVRLEGWTCAATSGPRRGTLVYLHGIADNRTSGLGIIQRFTALGFDVMAYDSRAHGESGGSACTYGYFEKDDLRLVLDQVKASDVVLIGTSLGAAVALQAGRTRESSDHRGRAVFRPADSRIRASAFRVLQGVDHSRVVAR